MDLADHIARVFGEKAAVQRKLGHQLGDKRLVAHAGEVVGLAELHLEEVPAQAFPERRTPGVVGHTAHLGNDLVAEQLRELGDKQHARLGQHATVEAVAVIGMQKQRAQFGITGEVVGQEQRRYLTVDIQFLGSADSQPNPEVVPRLAQANGASDGGDSHHAAFVVFQHEQVVGIAAPGFAAKGFFRPAHPVGQALFVGRQGGEAGASAARQINQGR